MRELSLFVSLLFFCTVAVADGRPLRFSVSDSSSMPMMKLQDGKPTDGILYDLYQRIAEKLGREAELQVISRTRIQPLLADDHVDASCYVSPAWLAEDDASYLWSVPFMTQHAVLVARPDAAAVRLAQLKGERIGTVLGFYYPKANALFKNGSLIRDDARTESQVLEKLEAGRNRYAISSETALRWFNRSRPARHHPRIIEHLVDLPVHCIVRNDSDAPVREVLDALEQMQQDGEFEVIQAKYR